MTSQRGKDEVVRTKDKAKGKGQSGKAEFVLWALSFGLVLSFVLCPLSFACTIGVFGPQATASGRPMLWKNRDVSNDSQAVRFFAGSKYRFITDVYAKDTANAWAGINEAGFAIMNSNSYNILDGDGDNADDGTVMKLALSTCATVNDFGHLMDSLDTVGRQTQANFGVFDSTGAASMFEAGNLYHLRYDCDEDTVGFILRANYSMSGSPNRETGKERYERAMELAVPARHAGEITPPWVIRTLSRDLGRQFFNPYPLPFDSTYGSLPFGFLPMDSTICCQPTRSAEVMVGPSPGQPAGRTMMWVLLGEPEVTLPIPVWVQGGPVPAALGGDSKSELCNEAIRLRKLVHSDPDHQNAVNTLLLTDVLQKLAPAESSLFAMVDSAETAWAVTGPTPEQASTLTEQACFTALTAYAGFWAKPDRSPCTPTGDPKPVVSPSITRGPILVQVGDNVRTGIARVFNTAGRAVGSLNVTQGQTVVHWSASGLVPGRYFVVFPAGSTSPPGRFTLLR